VLREADDRPDRTWLRIEAGWTGRLWCPLGNSQRILGTELRTSASEDADLPFIPRAGPASQEELRCQSDYEVDARSCPP
jgi:hypothetical protein